MATASESALKALITRLTEYLLEYKGQEGSIKISTQPPANTEFELEH